MTLDKIALWASILTAVGGGIVWLLNHLDKKALRKEEAKVKAKEIDMKLEHLQGCYDELAEDNETLKKELDDVRKDFAQFVQQLLFKTK